MLFPVAISQSVVSSESHYELSHKALLVREARASTIESTERAIDILLARSGHVDGVGSSSVNSSGLSGSSGGLVALLQKERAVLAELMMDMANLFKHFFRIGKAKQKSCRKELPSTGDKYADNEERLYDLNLPAFVKFNYTAKREDELSLVKGTKVIVMEKCSDGWWRGTYNGLCGWFPSNYVTEDVDGTMRRGTYREKLSHMGHNNNGTHILQTVQALYHFSSGNDEELSFNKDELMDVLEKPENDPEWWKCRKQNGHVGLVPKNYVTVLQTSDSDPGMPGPPTSNCDCIRPCMNGKFGGQLWYYGKVTRHQAEMVLNQRGDDGDFLVRDSESTPNDFSISLKAVFKNKHFKVQQKDGLFCIGQRKFGSMEKLVEHYKKAPIFTSEQGDKLYLIKALS